MTKWRSPIRLTTAGVYAFGWNLVPRLAWESEVFGRVRSNYRIVRKFGCGWLIVKAGRA